MPRSSRHKQHKQTKHSSKDVRERSDSEEDGYLKSRNGGDEITVRVTRDSASGEKRKIVSQSQDGNGDLFEDYVVLKRRKEGADVTDTDRWKGVEEERGKREKVDGSRADSEKPLKMNVLVDSNSNKSSRRNESLTKEKNAGMVIESGEVQKNGGNKVESKYKSEKDLRRKEVHQYKDGKEKERGADRDRKVRDLKRERSVDTVPGRDSEDGELGRKQGSQSGHVEEERLGKQELENDEWQLQDDLRNPELEKELEKRMRRRRDDSGEKDKYQDDISDGNNRGLSMKEDLAKAGKDKDERSDRDKYKDDRYRDKYQEDVNRDGRHRDDKRRGQRSSRDHTFDRPDIKHYRDESKTEENRHKKSRPHNGDRDGSPHLDDRGTRYKDNKEKKRSSKDNEGHSELKSLRTPELRSDIEKKALSSSKLSSLADKGRSQRHHVDVDSTVSSSKWKTSPNSSAHVAKDQYRYNSKQAESKYRDSISEERVRSSIASSRERSGLSGVFDRASERRSLEKPIRKEKFELSNERSRRSDAQASPKQLMEKSPSSSSIDRRYSNRSTLRRSLDVDEVGRRRSGSKDARDYSANEDRRSRDLPSEKPVADDFSQADGDTLSISSSFNRTSYLPGNSSLLPPPPLRTGVGSPLVLDEDSRGKPSNRYRRYGDPSVGRGLGNVWKGVPSWPSPVTNGFIPYPHGPPPGGFHPVMQQFPAHLFGIRPAMDLNHTGLPYHISDADRFSSHGRSFGWRNPADGACPPHLHGWDGSNGAFGDEPQMYGTADWDQNRHLMSGRGWETNTEMWKGQNSGVNMELPTSAQKEDPSQRVSSDEVWSGLSDQQPRTERNRPGSRAESIEINQSSSAPPEKDSTETPIKSSIKADDGGSRFCTVYLTKLDISADVTHPELYNQCMSLLEEEDATVNKDVTEHDYVEERTEAGVKISNTIESASFFPKINESIFQRAMALYKKQTEEMIFKHHISSFPESNQEKDPITEGDKLETTTDEEIPVPSSGLDCENLDPVSSSEQDNMIELKPASSDKKLEEPSPNLDQEEVEEADPVSDQERAEKETFPTSNQDKTEETSTQGQNLEESITVLVMENEEETDPTPVQETVEPILEKLEEVVEERSSLLEQAPLATTDSPCTEEETNRASDCEGNHGPEEQKAFGDAMCGSVGFSEGSSEGCEALMPESIECRDGVISASKIIEFYDKFRLIGQGCDL